MTRCTSKRPAAAAGASREGVGVLTEDGIILPEISGDRNRVPAVAQACDAWDPVSLCPPQPNKPLRRQQALAPPLDTHEGVLLRKEHLDSR